MKLGNLVVMLVALSAVGCDDQTFIVDASFEIDGLTSGIDKGFTKAHIDDLNLTTQMTPDFIVIPTGVAIAFTTTAFYVRVGKDEGAEFRKAPEWDQRSNWDAIDPPVKEELMITSNNEFVAGVEIVNNQDEADTRARWVIWGVVEGTTSIDVSGSHTEGTHSVPVQVVFQ